jgi:L-serine deaminase
LEQKYDAQFQTAFDAIQALMTPPASPRKPIGFRIGEAAAQYRIASKSRGRSQ